MGLSTGWKVAIGLTVVGGVVGGIAMAAGAAEKEEEEEKKKDEGAERPKVDPAFAAACSEAGYIPIWVPESQEWACKTPDGTVILQSKWPEKEEEAEPIYAFCEERDGTILTQEGHPPLCIFSDGRLVDAWEYLRGTAEPEFPEPPEGPGGEEPTPGQGLARPADVLPTDVVLVPGASVLVDPKEWDIDRIWVMLPYEAWGDFEARDRPWPGGPKAEQPGSAAVVQQAGMGEPGEKGAALFVRWSVNRPGQMWLFHRELNSGDEAKVSMFVPVHKHTHTEPLTIHEG